MKTKQSGFAIVGVAIAMVAILAGSAYVFRNAGTSDDLVAQVSRVVTGKQTGTSGSGSGTRSCPAECASLYTKARLAALAYADALAAETKACSANSNSKDCKNKKDKSEKAEEKASQAGTAYMNCVNKKGAHAYCPEFDYRIAMGLSPNRTMSCEELKQKVEGDDSSLTTAIAAYRQCMSLSAINNGKIDCSREKRNMERTGRIRDASIYKLKQSCPQYASVSYPSSQDIINAALKSGR